jgi:hypothetical protein
VAALLWEVGVLGLLFVLGLFAFAFLQARKLKALASAAGDPVKIGIARGMSASIVILTISLAHKDFFVYHIPFQTLITCIFGYLGAQLSFERERKWEQDAGRALAVGL